MDFRRLQNALKHTSANNGTTMNLTNLSPNILEAFIPGYSIISSLIEVKFGIDIGVLVTAGILCFAIVSGAKYFWKNFYESFRSLFMSYVVIDGKDDLFRHVLAWASEQRMTKNSRRLNAVSHSGAQQDDDSFTIPADEYVGEDGLFHFGKWAAKKPPTYEPAVGTHWFWHDGGLFVFVRSTKEQRSNPYQNVEEHRIVVRCVGRSTAPLKRWIESVKVWAADKQTSLTTIKRPTTRDSRRPLGNWAHMRSRPSRPLSTVVLEPEQKARLVADVNQYLHPATPKWYATRGIPYRRGYLFHGPPGTGKSSLSFALAGLFGLDIHVVSLSETGPNATTESELIMLFNNLPRRCIVLLEDIDSAGLSRDHNSDETNGAKDAKQENFIADIARELKNQGRRGRAEDGMNQGISLSGLLNAIDGVASHEGRVLIMTTNHPERLDRALIRPGRVDLQIAFTLATKHQAKEIFVRMFEEDEVAKIPTSSDRLGTTDKQESAKAEVEKAQTPKGTVQNGSLTPPPTPRSSVLFSRLSAAPELPMDRTDLEEMAARFAEEIPEDTFSPAEIQNFLIIRKSRPRQAMKDVVQWREDMLKSKNAGSKLAGGQ